MMKSSVLMLFSFIGLAATCQNTANDNAQVENPCDPDMICTMDFKVLSLTLVTEEGSPVLLDEFYTEFEDFTFKAEREEYQIQKGFYPVVNDGNKENLSFKGQSATFIGLKNGKEVVRHSLIIGKDCCHVLLMEGKLELMINNIK